MGDLTRVGAILGQPAAVDLTRPNEQSGATPLREQETDYPLYRIRKVCGDHIETPAGKTYRGCGRIFVGFSLTPQYDDEPERVSACDDCLDVFLDLQRWPAGRRHFPALAESAPSRQPCDPLDD